MRRLLLFLMFASHAIGATWYIDKDATGSNNGTSWENAWENLQYTLANSNYTVSAGDTIYISGGTYTSTTNMFIWNLIKGTVASPITLMYSNRNGVVTIDGKLSIGGNANNIVIDGASNRNYASTYVTNTIQVPNITNNLGIRIVHNYSNSFAIRQSGYSTNHTFKWLELSAGKQYRNHAVSYNQFSDGLIMHYCWIHDTGEDGINNDNSDASHWDETDIAYCLIENIGDDGIQMDCGITVHNSIIRNTLELAGHPDGFQTKGLYQKVYNNIIYDWNTVPYYPEQAVTNAGHIYFYGNIIYGEDPVDSQPAAIGYGSESKSPSNGLMTITNVLIFNNTIVGGSISKVQNPIQFYNRKGGSGLVMHITNCLIANNLFVDGIQFGADLKGGGVAYSNIWYREEDFLLDYNCISGTNANSFKLIYNGSNYSHVGLFTSGTRYDNNRTNLPLFVNKTGYDFRLSSNDTAAINYGTNLSAYTNFSTEPLDGIHVDLYGNLRGADGTWDIGANEYSGETPDTEKLYLHITFEDAFSDNVIDDSSLYNADMLNYGWTNDWTGADPNTNWPTRVTGKVGSYAGEFLPYYWNTNLTSRGWEPEFHDGQYGSITNIGSMIQMTQATFMVWMCSSNFPNETYDDYQATLFDSGYQTNGTWRFGRNSAHPWGQLSFMLKHSQYNGTPASHRFTVSWPTNWAPTPGSFDTEGWQHYAVTVDCTDPEDVAVKCYWFGTNLISTNYLATDPTNQIAFLTASDGDGSSFGPYISIGGWSHNGSSTPSLLSEQPNSGFWHGKMDNIRIYGRVLSDAEILDLYTEENGEETPNPAILTAIPDTFFVQAVTNTSPDLDYYEIQNIGDTTQAIDVTNYPSATWFTMTITNISVSNQYEANYLIFDTDELAAGSYTGYVTNKGWTNGVFLGSTIVTINLDITNGVSEEVAMSKKAEIRGRVSPRGKVIFR